MLLKDLKNKKILVLGFGKEGKDSYLALRKLFPKKVLGIADKKNGKDYLKSVGDYDLIIKTPGIPLSKVKPFLKKRTKVTSQTELFFDNFQGLIIGVTGTKGKGTTASLIHQILKRGGLKAHLVGNIGKPVFQKLLKSKKDDIFVYELSSHQLQGLKKSPSIAVFLNLFPDHLEYYKNFQEYKKAKESIALYQKKGDFFIYNADDKTVREIARKTKAKKIPFSLEKKSALAKIIKQKEIPLKGGFNVLNVMAAISVGKILNVPTKHIREAIKSFKPLPHRLEFIGKYKGIDFYNDSMSTIPEVTIAALEALGSKVKTLIVGGSEKGSDYSALAKKIIQSKVRTLIIFPGTGPYKIPRPWDFVRKFSAGSMQEAVKIAYARTHRGEVCLLSPAAASFNLFRDYKERGSLFKKWVKNYGSKHSKK